MAVAVAVAVAVAGGRRMSDLVGKSQQSPYRGERERDRKYECEYINSIDSQKHLIFCSSMHKIA